MTHLTSKAHAETAYSRASTCVPALYEVDVAHTRRAPITNHFDYKASYWLVDYDRLPRRRGVVGRLASFEKTDHCDVRATLAEHGVAAEHILMLAMARTLGYVFNPISVFWCYDERGSRVAVLVEVHNTYGGRHVYFLRPDEAGRSTVEKAMYVSPFYPVDGRYDIRVGDPTSSISVSVTMRRESEPPFVATLRGDQCAVNLRSVIRASLGRSALRVSLLIRWQAVRLWARGLKVQPQ